MANTTKNKKEKKKKRKNSTRKSSSNQKENRPKNKVIKPNPSDCITMSKQLVMKKSSNIHVKRRASSKNENRVCGNGKPLPSLADLEKMFEDSDDDGNPPKSPQASSQTQPSCLTSTPQKPIVVSENQLLSPKTIAKISEKVIDLISNISDPSELLDAIPPPPVIPQKKRKKTDIPYIVGCKDRPKVPSRPSTNFCKGDDDYGVQASCEDPEDASPKKRAKKSRIPAYTKSIFNAKSDEIAEKLTKDNTGSVSDESSDSNKTVEYNPMAFQSYKPRSFSPMPSTSTDNEIFIKNDKLFNESLRAMNIINENIILNNESVSLEEESNTSDSFLKNENFRINNNITKVVLKNENLEESPTINENVNLNVNLDESVTNHENKTLGESLTENDNKNFSERLIINKNNNLGESLTDNEKLTDTKNDNDLQIIDIPYETIVIDDVVETGKFEDTNDFTKVNDKKHNDDDDCILITDSTERKIENPNEPIVIEDEYSNIDLSNDICDTEPIEIIDIDDVIAENKSIIDKWKNYETKEFNKIHVVVDVPTTYRNTNSLQPNTNITPESNMDFLRSQTNSINTPQTSSNSILANADLTLHSNSSAMINATTIPETSCSTNASYSASTPPISCSLYTSNVIPQTNCINSVTSLTPQSSLNSILDLDSYSIISSNNVTNAPISGNVNLNNTNNETNYVNWLTMEELDRYLARNTRSASRVDNTIPLSQSLRDYFENSYSTTEYSNISHGQNTARRNAANSIASLINFDQITLPPARTGRKQTKKKTPSNSREKKSYNPTATTSGEKPPSNPTPASSNEKQTPTRNIGECPICMDPLANSGIASTMCGHVFCLKCIQAAIKANGKRCPTCRKALKGAGGGYHQLYL